MAIARFNWAPFTAIAAVAATFSRVFMLVVAALIAWIVIGIGAGDAAGPLMTPPFALETLSIFMVCSVLGILIYQYSVRGTVRARIALATTLFLALGLYWGFTKMYFTGPVNSLVYHRYPVSAGPSPRLTFNSSSYAYGNHAAEPPPRGDLWASIYRSVLKVSTLLSGLTKQMRRSPSMSGYNYVSPWRPVTIDEQGFLLLIPWDTFNHIHTADVRMHLTFVGQRLLPGSPQVVTATDRFKVSNNGNCILNSNQLFGNLVCRYAFQSPPPTRISGSVSTQSCDHPEATRPGSANVRFLPAGSRVDPVIQESLQLGGMVCPVPNSPLLPITLTATSVQSSTFQLLLLTITQPIRVQGT